MVHQLNVLVNWLPANPVVVAFPWFQDHLKVNRNEKRPSFVVKPGLRGVVCGSRKIGPHLIFCLYLNVRSLG